MRRAFVRRGLGAAVLALAHVACTHEPTAADLRPSIVPEERAALDAVLSRAGVEASTLGGRTALLDFFWRGRTSYAKKLGGNDLEDTVDRRTPDGRNAVAVEGGHVVALRLAGTRIDDLRLFAPLTHLVVLDVHDAAIPRIEGLDALAQLDHLDLSGNRLARIEGLDGLQALRSLYLTDDHLERIEGLESLAHLEVLNLGANRIARIEGLEGLRHLRALLLESNRIARIEGLDVVPELVDLDLAWCPVEALDNLETMPELRYLNLRHDRVRSLAGIERATPALLYIGLGENDLPYNSPEERRLCARYCQGRMITFF